MLAVGDLYGIFVFSEEAEEQIDRQIMERKESLRQIRQGIFLEAEEMEEDELKQIHSQIFQAAPTFPAAERAEYTERTKAVPSVFLLADAALIGFVTILLFYKRTLMRKKGGENDDSDYD